MRKWWHLAAVAAGAIACRGTAAYADLHHALRSTAHANVLQQVALNDTCLPWRPELAENIYVLQAMAPLSDDGTATISGQESEKQGFYIDELGFCNDPTCPCHDSVIGVEGPQDRRRPVTEADSFQEALEQTTEEDQGYAADNPAADRSEAQQLDWDAIEEAEHDGFAGEASDDFGVQDDLYGYVEDEADLSAQALSGNEIAEQLNDVSDGVFDDPFGWEYGAESADQATESVQALDESEGWIHRNLINDPYPVADDSAFEDAAPARPEAVQADDEPTWIDYGEFDFAEETATDTEVPVYEDEWLREMEDEQGLGLYDAGMTDEELAEAYGEEPTTDTDAWSEADLVDSYLEGQYYDEEELYEDWRSDELPPVDVQDEHPRDSEQNAQAEAEAAESSSDFSGTDEGVDFESDSFEPYSYDDFYSPEAYEYDDYDYDGYLQDDNEPIMDESSDGFEYYDSEYYDIEYYDARYDSYDEGAEQWDRYIDPTTYDSPEQVRQYESEEPSDSAEADELHLFYPGEDWSEYQDSVNSTDRSSWNDLFDPAELVEIVLTVPYAGRVGAMVEQTIRWIAQASEGSDEAVTNALLANITDSNADEADSDNRIEQLIGDGGELMCPYCQIRGWEYEALNE